MSFTPAPQHFLIRVSKVDTKVPGIMLPADVHSQYEVGTVLAAGKGRLLRGGEHANAIARDGDTVYFTKGDGVPVRVDGEESRVVHERCILGVRDDD